mmetsp:Transcript_9893/g.15857  ORF Transcript_9893/g.15857 Transcript_9893/m.15857 type:complete len:197 (-) Transcript_9893:286-876(-)|eukprot:CAMPEP_0178744262 /NCGR_PEP_ID=MMETSP0744-20121128/6672_1 /TAXON_ID=913974 /ORGANISM="Nitzschia punctata, Strain CCMP561" /LENGTH=196 /DNA_ID=CAMNT_0020397375 /DNA_START=60 /DNA_END=650 /DNA_ORIENTATION=+
MPAIPLQRPLSPHIVVNVGRKSHVQPSTENDKTTTSRQERHDHQNHNRYCAGKRRRSVTFSMESNTEIAYLHRNDYSSRERLDSWFTNDEFDQMKRDRQMIIKRTEKPNGQEDEENTLEFCMRGLEWKTKEGRRNRYLEWESVVISVLDEQDLQMQKGIVEEDVIAYLCEMNTRQSITKAHQRGLRDAQEASKAAI